MRPQALRRAVLPVLIATTLLSPPPLAEAAIAANASPAPTPQLSAADLKPVSSAEEAITLASELRMLSQRLYKNYVFSGLNVRARKANNELQQALHQFDRSLARLTAYAHNDHQTVRCHTLQQAWLKIRPIYLAQPEKGKVSQLQQLNKTLLRASYANVTAFMIYGDSQYGQMVNLAGEQTMLSQRIAALYGLMSWGFESEFKPSYEKVEKDFNHNLEILFENLINTPKVDRSLDRVKRQFSRFSRASNMDESIFVPALIDRSAEKMLQEMLEVTQMYAKLSKE